jgi:hypothetical protein
MKYTYSFVVKMAKAEDTPLTFLTLEPFNFYKA